MNNSKLGWKIFGLFVSLFLIVGGLSGEFVLRGTESSTALVVVGFLFLIWDIFALATHKKQAKTEENAEASAAPVQDEVKLENNALQDQNQSAPVPVPVPEAPEKGKSTVFAGPEKPYYLLEHRTGSRYHEAGEKQKIVIDHAEIGRDSNCAVRYDEQFETVSRRHAAIIRNGNDWKLVAMSKTNPTFVNGKMVQGEWYLQHGDEIQCAVNGPKLVFKIVT